MASLNPAGVDTTTGQVKRLTSSDSLVDSSGTPIGGGGLSSLISFPSKHLPNASGSYVFTYPGAGAFDMNQEGGAINTIGFGQESDGSQFTSYGSYIWSFEDSTQGPGFSLFIAIPSDFTGWDTNAIRIYQKVIWTGGGSSGTIRLSMEALDPVSGGSFGSPKLVTRDVAYPTSDTSYVALTLSSTTMSTDFSAGQMIQLDFSGVEQVAGDSVPDVRFGQLQMNWN